MIGTYKDLKVWQKSMELVKEIYIITSLFPKDEIFGLTSQMRRCAVSVPSNIAEGAGRNSDKEFCHFLSVAHGSFYELETQLIVSQRLELIDKTISDELCAKINEVQKMSYNLQSKLKAEI